MAGSAETATVNGPLSFVPFLRPMVWGGRRLKEVLGKSLPTDEAYGESWEISDHASHQSIVASGPLAGKTLRQLMDEDRAALLGDRAEPCRLFPCLMTSLHPRHCLPVPVHPH